MPPKFGRPEFPPSSLEVAVLYVEQAVDPLVEVQSFVSKDLPCSHPRPVAGALLVRECKQDLEVFGEFFEADCCRQFCFFPPLFLATIVTCTVSVIVIVFAGDCSIAESGSDLLPCLLLSVRAEECRRGEDLVECI